MNVKHLEYLVTTAALGSISAAAAQLHISQPALSAAIQNIEQEYQIQIFHRTKSGVQLTEQGQLFIRHTRKIVTSISELHVISGMNISGTLKIASVPGINNSIMPLAIASFSKKYPLVSIELEEDGSHAVKRAVDENLVSIGICSTRDFAALDSANYTYHRLARGHVTVCLSPDHPLSSCQEISIKMLNGYSLVIFNRSFRMYTHVISMLEKIGTPQVILTASNCELAKKVILETNSVGFLSNILLSNDYHIQTGKLLSIPLAEEHGTDFITLQKRDQSNNRLAQHFIREIRRQAKIFFHI